MLKNDNLAIFLAMAPALLWESVQSPFVGFYIVPAVISLAFFFVSPLVFRSLNAFLAGLLGWLALCAWQWQILYFTIPYFIILSLIIYVFAKK